MTDNLREFLVALGNGGDEFVKLIELDDKQFEASYPSIKGIFAETFDSVEFKESLRQQIIITPHSSIEDEQKGIDTILDEINGDDSLSDLKKELLIYIVQSSSAQALDYMQNPSKRIDIQIVKSNPDAVIPTYAHDGDAGMDVYAPSEVTIPAGETVIVPTGLKVAIPIGYEIQVRSRSGMAAKTKLRIANGVGTIDSNYRGEIGVIFDNIGSEDYTINKGDRIAQLVLNEVPIANFIEVDELDDTNRGEGGFGSSGK